MSRRKTRTPNFIGAIALLDRLRTLFSLKNDAQLAAWLGWKPPIISKIRHHQIAMSGWCLIDIHIKSGIPMRELVDAVNTVN